MEKVDVFKAITKSVEKFRSADHNMAEDSLVDSYFRGDFCDIEDRLQEKFLRKYSRITPIQCPIDFDFNFEFD